MPEFRMRDAVLEKLLRAHQIAALSIVTWTKHHHQTEKSNQRDLLYQREETVIV